jgi:hypothetical protein
MSHFYGLSASAMHPTCTAGYAGGLDRKIALLKLEGARI